MGYFFKELIKKYITYLSSKKCENSPFFQEPIKKLANFLFAFSQAYRDYNDACLQHIQGGNNATLANYYDAHNAYVQQLKGTNAMYREYHNETLPALLQVSWMENYF